MILTITRSANVKFHVPAVSKEEQILVTAYLAMRREELARQHRGHNDRIRSTPALPNQQKP